jgi:uncharacterized membrane protein HdeD (DUF308 family)
MEVKDMATEISLDQAAGAMREAMRKTVKRHALWYLLQGVLMVLGGLVALVYPLVSSVAVVVFIGWLLIITGVVQAIGLIGARHVPHFWLQLISVTLAAIIGFLFIQNPGEALVTLTLLLIVFFMVEGIAKIIFALTIRPLPNWGWPLVSGLIGVLLSVYLLTNPVEAIWLLGLLVGIMLITEGAALAYLAWQVRKAPSKPAAQESTASGGAGSTAESPAT